MNRRLKGNIGEAKVLTYFIENEYDVYLPFQENGECDMIVCKDGILYRVSIKFTSQKSNQGFAVELRNVSRRKDNQVIVKDFNKQFIDLLAVYIQPLDKVVVIETKDIKGKNSIVVH